METKYTQGPWSVTDGNTICGKSGLELAFVRTATIEPGEANARLIAAAPELLEAAQEMADLLENLLSIGAINPNLIISESISNVLPIHRAAIAKAI